MILFVIVGAALVVSGYVALIYYHELTTHKRTPRFIREYPNHFAGVLLALIVVGFISMLVGVTGAFL